jgi:hypothetical protein
VLALQRHELREVGRQGVKARVAAKHEVDRVRRRAIDAGAIDRVRDM